MTPPALDTGLGWPHDWSTAAPPQVPGSPTGLGWPGAHVSRETESTDTPAATGDPARTADPVWPLPARRRVLAVANQKGGVGKTTSAVNVAAALAQHGARVLVVDLDPQGNASTALGVAHPPGTPSTYDVVAGDATLDSVVVTTGVPGVACAPATADLAGAEVEMVPMVGRESRLAHAVAAYGGDVHYVLIDCPPALGLLTVNALVAADEVFIPIQAEYYALEGLGALAGNIELIRSRLNDRLRIGAILLTMYDSRTRLADQVAGEVPGHFGDAVLTTTIPRSVRIAEAPSFGEPVITYDPGSAGARAYAAAARELAERGAGEAA